MRIARMWVLPLAVIAMTSMLACEKRTKDEVKLSNGEYKKLKTRAKAGEDAAQKMAQAEEMVQKAEASMARAEQIQEDSQGRMSEANAKLAAAEAAALAAGNKINSAKAEQAAAEAAIAQQFQSLANLKEQEAKTRRAKAELDQKITENNTKIAELEVRKAELTQQELGNSEAMTEINQAIAEQKALKAQNEKASRALDQRLLEVETAESELKQATEQHDLFVNQTMANLAAAKATAEEAETMALRAQADNEAAIATLEAKRAALAKQTGDNQAILAQNQAAIDSLRQVSAANIETLRETAELRKEIEAAEERAARLLAEAKELYGNDARGAFVQCRVDGQRCHYFLSIQGIPEGNSVNEVRNLVNFSHGFGRYKENGAAMWTLTYNSPSAAPKVNRTTKIGEEIEADFDGQSFGMMDNYLLRMTKTEAENLFTKLDAIAGIRVNMRGLEQLRIDVGIKVYNAKVDSEGGNSQQGQKVEEFYLKSFDSKTDLGQVNLYEGMNEVVFGDKELCKVVDLNCLQALMDHGLLNSGEEFKTQLTQPGLSTVGIQSKYSFIDKRGYIKHDHVNNSGTLNLKVVDVLWHWLAKSESILNRRSNLTADETVVDCVGRIGIQTCIEFPWEHIVGKLELTYRIVAPVDYTTTWSLEADATYFQKSFYNPKPQRDFIYRIDEQDFIVVPMVPQTNTSNIGNMSTMRPTELENVETNFFRPAKEIVNQQ